MAGLFFMIPHFVHLIIYISMLIVVLCWKPRRGKVVICFSVLFCTFSVCSGALMPIIGFESPLVPHLSIISTVFFTLGLILLLCYCIIVSSSSSTIESRMTELERDKENGFYKD